jgi:hypothetical protein
VPLIPEWIALGWGKFSQDLALNVGGLILCTLMYLAGLALQPATGSRTAVRKLVEEKTSA